MSKYSYKIIDFQCLSNESGIFLTEQGELYSYNDSDTIKIDTPTEFGITDFHFLDKNNGIIIGEGGRLEKEIQKGSLLPDFGLPLLISLLIVLTLKVRLNQRLGMPITRLLSVLIIPFIMVSCNSKWQKYKSIDPNNPFITNILKAPNLPFTGFHTYFGNKGVKSYISITDDGGKSWETHDVKTNFHLTTVTSIGANYFVGSFANYNTSKNIPYHGDGDVYIYGSESVLCPDLSKNVDLDSPFGIDIQRGVNGFYHDRKRKMLYVFGSETEPQIPKSEISTSQGNISQLSTDLKSIYRIIDVPDKVSVTSLSVNSQLDIWVTLDNKTPEVADGYVEFKTLPTRKLLVLRENSNKWEEVIIHENVKSFLQIEFIPDTNEGYLIAEENRQLFKTTDGGLSWSTTNMQHIKTIKPFNNRMWLLNEDGEILVL